MQPLNMAQEDRTAYGGGGSSCASVWTSGGIFYTAVTRAWYGISLAFVFAALGYGVVYGGHVQRWSGAIGQGADRLVRDAGFGVKQIAISGLRRLSRHQILRAIGAERPISIFSIDTKAAERRMQALSWVKNARAVRLLPSTLNILVEEREAFAYWQIRGEIYLIDEEGNTIRKATFGEFGDLPIVVGEGAALKAGEILSALEDYPEIEARLHALVRVADRRWTLKLVRGPDILLPENEPGQGLARLAALHQKNGLLSGGFSSVDLRLSDRIAVHLSKAQSQARKSGAPLRAQPPTPPGRDA